MQSVRHFRKFLKPKASAVSVEDPGHIPSDASLKQMREEGTGDQRAVVLATSD